MCAPSNYKWTYNPYKWPYKWLFLGCYFPKLIARGMDGFGPLAALQPPEPLASWKNPVGWVSKNWGANTQKQKKGVNWIAIAVVFFCWVLFGVGLMVCTRWVVFSFSFIGKSLDVDWYNHPMGNTVSSRLWFWKVFWNCNPKNLGEDSMEFPGSLNRC